MLTITNYTVDTKIIQEAVSSLPSLEMRTAINEPTGNFFYDPWILKEEYKGTVWEKLYNSLPTEKGEARIIVLEPNQCYQIHADIDDRYHLNISGDECFLIDLVREQMYKLNQDGTWYDMNAGFLHTAANFGRPVRVQLVVRKLLKKNKLIDPVNIAISTTLSNPNHARSLFDNTISPWLNSANKAGIINNFSHSQLFVKFDIEKNKLEFLKQILPKEFKIL